MSGRQSVAASDTAVSPVQERSQMTASCRLGRLGCAGALLVFLVNLREHAAARIEAANQFTQTLQCGGPNGADSTYCATVIK